MPSDTVHPGPPAADPARAREFREVLDRQGYCENGLVGALGPVQLPKRPGEVLPYTLHLTREGRPLDVLIRLFLLGAPVEVEAARGALEPVPLAGWVDAGLLGVDAGTARGKVRILAFRDLLIACDYPLSGNTEEVMGVTASSVALADFTIRRPSRLTLDLGAGGGLQLLLAARHSEQVVATDLSPRCLAFARFNAALNRCDEKISFVLGNAFEPVRGRTFDLIASNPPFAITPWTRYVYRDNGMQLDHFCQNLIREAPEFLNEGGVFHLLADWVHLRGQPWKERVSAWFDGLGCDAWVLRTDHHSAAAYAHIWVRDTERESETEMARLYDEMLAYYDREGVETISTGLIALRKTGGRRNRIRIEDAPVGQPPPYGNSILLGFLLGDYLDRFPADTLLLQEKLRISPAARLEETCEPAGDAWRPSSARIRMAEGLPYVSDIDLRLAALLARCDGHRTLGDLLAEMATALNADLEKITPNCVSLVRQLIERGFLLPASMFE